MDNIALGPDAQANHTLAVLRGDTMDGTLGKNVEFLPGLTLRADPALDLQGTWRSPPGRLLELEAAPGAPGDWIGLHLTLPLADLAGIGSVGFAARASASKTTVLRACFRSGVGRGFVDTFFDKQLLLRPEEASHVDVLAPRMRADMPERAPWRELIFFLPTEAFRIALIDLRVFAV
ncbi:hypothetical protein RXV86_21725 [Alisedimentitalea sp. MJ-SS2]|uniref:hypothetical protein n=1 Tax=Aliisedimentitalea sp. MJ-SS2 TaxID=3049795 RepID=UPI0029097E70|nr:hypothetical protein [Alisedimentitalea sp. MJ-SS2]MDU8930014.1 hypothetical protein [Alisedimentitalea sp. MJ-SS2]